jgi:hypothetical protein
VQILSETGDGNDLPPRHRKGQILGNVTFILAKEPAIEALRKAMDPWLPAARRLRW